MKEATKSGFYKSNNFDIIRLFAELQVIAVHLIEHFYAGSLPWFGPLIAIFPGFPFLFFISGFLISAAWNRNPDVKMFALNRIYNNHCHCFLDFCRTTGIIFQKVSLHLRP